MCRNLTVHGPSFLARGDIAFIYKLIYFIIYLQVWIGAVATIVKYCITYQENTIRFTTRTDYLHWNTTFPSITICEIGDMDEKVSDNYNNNTNILNSLYVIKEISFFKGICHTCSSSFGRPLLNVTYVNKKMSLYRADCKNFFIKCEWNYRNIDCCNAFKPVNTEFGMCFTINNNHAPGSLPLHVGTSQEYTLRTLTVAVSKNSEAFLHSPEDLPFWNMEFDRRITVKNGVEATMLFSITDIVNEREVSLTPPDERKCRFPDELPADFQAFRSYSYSVCIIQCRIEKQLELCNCTQYISPVYSEYCDVVGFECLSKNYPTLKKLKIPGVNDTGLSCDCLPSCIESDYNIVAKKMNEPETINHGGKVHFALSNKPFERITRQVARTTLDLVVAVGNCFGLCFGGSLLSIVEVVYYVCLRRWKL